jgi:CRP/FNR family transcriptional regulator
MSTNNCFDFNATDTAVGVLEPRIERGEQLKEGKACDVTAMNYFISQIEPCCEYIDLRPQQRLMHTIDSRKIIALREGALAIEVVLPNGRRQILDFLLPGDIVSTSSLRAPPAVPVVSIRAMTGASLVCADHRVTPHAGIIPGEYWETLFAQSQAQLARANAHQLMIGYLDTTSRVASFLLAIALRTCGGTQLNLRFALPMSRDDIADYLAINPDTLSRIMMRFESLTLIERVSRREVRVGDINKLKGHTPIAQLLSSVFGHRTPGLAN